MLRSAGTGDPELGAFIAADHAARRERQRNNIHTIAHNGQLRVATDVAADTYSALASPDTYLLFTDQFGWSAQQYQPWLVETATRLLLTRPTE